MRTEGQVEAGQSQLFSKCGSNLGVCVQQPTRRMMVHNIAHSSVCIAFYDIAYERLHAFLDSFKLV